MTRAPGFALGFLLVALLAAPGCGKSDSDEPGSAQAGNSTIAGAGGGSGNAHAGANAGGNASAGSATSAGGKMPTGGQASGGNEALAGAASGGSAGTSADLLDCDPKKIACKRATPVCDAGEVPSVEGTCYGDCVKVEQCRCSVADQCPEPEQYTCWSKQHCGPYVQ